MSRLGLEQVIEIPVLLVWSDAFFENKGSCGKEEYLKPHRRRTLSETR